MNLKFLAYFGLDNMGMNNGMQDKFSWEFENDDRKVNDTFVISNAEYIFLNIGVLYTEYATLDKDAKEFAIFSMVIDDYKKYGQMFPKKLRGAFCGFLYDKKEDILILFGDHTSNRRVFWYFNDGTLIASSDLPRIASFMDEHNIKVNLFYPAAHMMCSHGCMLYDATLIDGVKKLLPGSTISFDLKSQSKPSMVTYFDMNEIVSKNINYEKALSSIEETFSNAIDLEFKRDISSNAKHLITLSGGLDSRAVRFVARDLNYNQVLDITMSQTGYKDELIAEKIISDLDDDYVFMALNGGKFLLQDISLAVRHNGGTVIYQGNAHLDKLIDVIDNSSYGLLHTGMIGDAIIGGSFIRNNNNPYLESGAYSVKVVKLLSDYFDGIKEHYQNNELFLLYNRGINGAFNGLYSTQRKLEAVSAFIDPDVIKLNLEIPSEYRKNSKLYIAWMQKYHSDMLKYEWERIGCKPNSNKFMIDFIHLYKGVSRFLNKKNKLSMNPYNYWYFSNANFRSLFDMQVKEAVRIIGGYDSNLLNLYKSLIAYGNPSEKMQLISLAYAMKVLRIVKES